jgi:hypothetical protein
VLWLWPKVIQQELDDFRMRANDFRSRYDSKKVLPSGVTPNQAMGQWQAYEDTQWCLMKVDRDIIKQLMDGLFPDGSPLEQWGVRADIADYAESALKELDIEISSIRMQDAWDVFKGIIDFFDSSDDDDA